MSNVEILPLGTSDALEVAHSHICSYPIWSF